MDKIYKSKGLAFVAAFGVVVLGNLSASVLNGDPLYKWLPGGESNTYRSYTATLTIILLIWAMWHLYKYRSVFQSIRMISENKKQDFNVGIILLLSPKREAIFKGDSIEIPTSDGSVVTIPNVSDGPTIDTMRSDVELLNKTRQWPWQQILRGVCHHYNSVKFIYILGSKNSCKTTTTDGGKKELTEQKGSGSFGHNGEHIDKAKCLLQAYKKNVLIKTHAEAVDFECFDELRDALDIAIRWMRSTDETKKEKVGDKDIVIDITGGQKTASITGAMVTLDNNLSFQYVQTGGDFEVKSFNVEAQSPATPL